MAYIAMAYMVMAFNYKADAELMRRLEPFAIRMANLTATPLSQLPTNLHNRSRYRP